MRRPYSPWLILFVLAFCLPVGGAETRKPISLQEAIDYASANHPRLHAARVDVKIREAGVTESRAGWFPEISANAVETTGFASSTGGLGVRGLANSPYKRGWGVDLEVEQMIFDFGRTLAVIRGAIAEKDISTVYRTLTEMRCRPRAERVPPKNCRRGKCGNIPRDTSCPEGFLCGRRCLENPVV